MAAAPPPFYFRAQADWYDRLAAESSFWVNVEAMRDDGPCMVECRVRVGPHGVLSTSDADFTASDLRGAGLGARLTLTACGSGGRSTRAELLAPRRVLPGGAAGAAQCVALSPGGELVLSGYESGLALIHSQADGAELRRLEGHASCVCSVRFFPSGQVALTSGDDLSLRIWSVADGSCPAVLRGHERGVTASAIVERGRNVLSASRDGTVRLWDCGTQQALARFATDERVAVHALALLGECPLCDPAGGGVSPHEREVGTAGKLACAGAGDGAVYGFDVRARARALVCRADVAAPCLSLATWGETCLAAGYDDGRLRLWDIRRADRARVEVRRSLAPVTALCTDPAAQLLFVGTRDGMASAEETDELAVRVNFSAADFEPVTGAASWDSTHVAFCCRDGSIRLFEL